MTTMYDAIAQDIGNIPDNPASVAGYVDGFGAWTQADWDRFPNAKHLTITVSAGVRARTLDVETGDATAGQAPGWYHGRADRSHGKPVLYASASNVASVIQAMQASGVSRTSYLIWSAHIGEGEHICGPHTCGFPQADGTQWTFTVDGRLCDQSLLEDDFFTTPAVHARGLANAKITFNLSTGHWHIEHEPGDAHFGPDDRWASAEIQINERTGHWRVAPLPFNARPLGR